MENGTGIGDEMWEGRFYCFCGSSLEVNAAPHVVREAKRLFWREHDGPGHGMCDRKTCNAARMRAEAQTLMEVD